jgi:transposase InsO family protein
MPPIPGVSYGVTTKDKAPDCLALLLVDYHKRFGLNKLKHLHSDQEASMTSAKTQTWLDKKGINFTSSPTDTPELNGLAEETNKWLGHKAVALMHHSGREVQFWVFAYEYAVSIKNIMPFKTSKGLMSSKEFLLSQVPDASWFVVWGCKMQGLSSRTQDGREKGRTSMEKQ